MPNLKQKSQNKKKKWEQRRQQIFDKAKNKEDAGILFDVLHRTAGNPNSVGKTFSEEEIGQTFVECMLYSDPPTTGRERKGKRSEKTQLKESVRVKVKKATKGIRLRPWLKTMG